MITIVFFIQKGVFPPEARTFLILESWWAHLHCSTVSSPTLPVCSKTISPESFLISLSSPSVIHLLCSLIWSVIATSFEDAACFVVVAHFYSVNLYHTNQHLNCLPFYCNISETDNTLSINATLKYVLCSQHHNICSL